MVMIMIMVMVMITIMIIGIGITINNYLKILNLFPILHEEGVVIDQLGEQELVVAHRQEHENLREKRKKKGEEGK